MGPARCRSPGRLLAFRHPVESSPGASLRAARAHAPTWTCRSGSGRLRSPWSTGLAEGAGWRHPREGEQQRGDQASIGGAASIACDPSPRTRPSDGMGRTPGHSRCAPPQFSAPRFPWSRHDGCSCRTHRHGGPCFARRASPCSRSPRSLRRRHHRLRRDVRRDGRRLPEQRRHVDSRRAPPPAGKLCGRAADLPTRDAAAARLRSRSAPSAASASTASTSASATASPGFPGR